MSALKDSDIAYMAGFFDGEGCVTFQRVGKAKNYYTYSPSVTCANNSLSLLVKLQSQFGGKVYKRKARSEKHGASYLLNFTNQEAMLRFLKTITPFLKLKKERAEKVIEFIESRKTKLKIRGQHYKLTDHELSLMQQVRDANASLSKKVVTKIERMVNA